MLCRKAPWCGFVTGHGGRGVPCRCPEGSYVQGMQPEYVAGRCRQRSWRPFHTRVPSIFTMCKLNDFRLAQISALSMFSLHISAFAKSHTRVPSICLQPLQQHRVSAYVVLKSFFYRFFKRPRRLLVTLGFHFSIFLLFFLSFNGVFP